MFFFCVGILATDSTAHVNLAAELTPIEYRWPTLLMFWLTTVKSLTPADALFQGKVHQAATREQDAASSAGGAPGGEDHCASGPTGRGTQDPKWDGHREQVSHTFLVLPDGVRKKKWPLLSLSCADWIVSVWLNCSSRLRTFKKLCRVKQLNLMMWVIMGAPLKSRFSRFSFSVHHKITAAIKTEKAHGTKRSFGVVI